MPHRIRQSAAAAGTTLSLLLLLAACGGGSDAAPGQAAGEGGAEQSETTAGFPVTVEHRYGSTTVDERPQRVVSVGYTDQDHLLALGVTPVADREWYGEWPQALWPWAQDQVGEDVDIEVLPSAEIDVEAVAALEPDLIVGLFSGMTQEEYDLLSRLAPTITSDAEYPEFGTPWREVTQTYADALGESDAAERIVSDVDAQLAAVREEHPEFDGATAGIAFYASGELGVYTQADLRSRLLEDLGFDVPQTIDDAAGEGAFFAPVSQENADLLDYDVLVWITATEEEIAEVRDLPIRQTLTAAQEGREVFLPFDLNGAMSFSTPLSIPYALDGVVPELEAAVDGDPATPVPSAQE